MNKKNQTYGTGLLLMIVLMSCGSCKQNNSESSIAIDDSIITNDVPSDFLDFYMKFHSESTFQIAHIVFPLAEKKDGSHWQKEDWQLHKPFDDSDGQFQRQFTNVGGLILEVISDGTGMFTIERRFASSGDSYNLIFYRVINAFENSEDWEQG